MELDEAIKSIQETINFVEDNMPPELPSGVDPVFERRYVPIHVHPGDLEALRALVAAAEAGRWRGIEEALKNGAPILAKMHSDIYPRIEPNRPDLKPLHGRYIVLRNNGLADDGFDFGWMVDAPVGYGGLPDEWIEKWRPLPPAPEA